MAEASVSFAGTSPPPYAATPATHRPLITLRFSLG